MAHISITFVILNHWCQLKILEECLGFCVRTCVGLLGRNQFRPLPTPTSNTPKVPRWGRLSSCDDAHWRYVNWTNIKSITLKKFKTKWYPKVIEFWFLYVLRRNLYDIQKHTIFVSFKRFTYSSRQFCRSCRPSGLVIWEENDNSKRITLLSFYNTF